MSQAPRQSRGRYPIRPWRSEIRRVHTGPGTLVRGRLLSCAAGVPNLGLSGALCRVCAAIRTAEAGRRPPEALRDKAEHPLIGWVHRKAAGPVVVPIHTGEDSGAMDDARLMSCSTPLLRAVSSVGTSACFTRKRSLVRAQYRLPNLTIDRTIFEMWLVLAGRSSSVTARS